MISTFIHLVLGERLCPGVSVPSDAQIVSNPESRAKCPAFAGTLWYVCGSMVVHDLWGLHSYRVKCSFTWECP